MDRVEQIERLQRLRENGALTEEEFAAEKAAVMAHGAGKVSTLSRVAMAFILVGAAVAGGWWFAQSPDVDRPAALAAASNVRDEALAKNKPVAPPPTTADLPEARQLELAAIAVLGVAGEKTVRQGEETRVTRAERLLRLPFGPVLVTSTELVDGCHACAGALGVFYLKDESDGFAVVRRWPEAVTGWGWGQPPSEWSISRAFSGYPVIVASGGYTGQGITCSGTTLTELHPTGPITSDLVPTGYSNGGAVVEDEGQTSTGERVRELEGKISDVVKGRSFTVTVSGTESFTEKYLYRNGKFVRTSGDTRLGC